VPLVSDKVMSTLFFQPSTRTRTSFETAMQRLGGAVISEANPMVTSSAAKEESLSDMLKVVSKYANIIVIRHPNDVEAREAVPLSEAPVINGGLGHWEHPTQALLDLYTLWSMYGRIEGLNVCIASPDLIGARTGHSMAYGLARLGANIVLASDKANRTPEEVINKIYSMGAKVEESFDHTQDSFNEMIRDMDMVYLPGCSAPKGPESEKFKDMMERYFVRYETLKDVYEKTRKNIYVTHTLPRREGEMDLRIDNSPFQLCFKAIGFSVSLRMALVASILGVD
ncbi:MAG: aspartate carbamoyltransferase, partial [Chloroflexota bacterium]|nr:aspartate carbamoyltransferase [Chloroflexota bacterium]